MQLIIVQSEELLNHVPPHIKCIAIGVDAKRWNRLDGALIAAPHAEDSARNAALADYRNCMGEMAQTNAGDLLWWASDLASKNRVASALNPVLQAMMRTSEAVTRYRGEAELALADVPQPVVHSIRALATERGWPAPREIAKPLAALRHRFAKIAYRLIWLARDSRRCWRNIRAARRTYCKPPSTYGQVTLLKSFVYASAITDAGEYKDPFFGPLRPYLIERANCDRTVMTLVLGFGDQSKTYPKLKKLSDNSPVVPVESYLRPIDVLRALPQMFRAIFFGFRTAANLRFSGLPLSPALTSLMRCAGGYVPIEQYLHLAAGKRISAKHAVDRVILTCEGNPWERMLVAGLREANPELSTIGYQHTVVPQAASGMFLDPREASFGPIPDQLLTAGTVPAEIIERYGALKKWAHPACALRFDSLFRLEQRPRPTGQHRMRVLVALEGLIEVTDLVSYVLRQAPDCPDVDFAIRAHPVLGLSEILAQLGNPALPDNVKASEPQSVADDVTASDVVLYWGTTVAMEAILMGVPVIHFDRGDVFSYDPLFELSEFKWTVNQDMSLAPILTSINDIADETYDMMRRTASSYVRSYFLRPSPESMELFITRGGT